MHFSEIFIRRPVLSTVLAALITFLGLASVANLPVRQYPEVEESVITITTVYPGAAPDLIQGFVTSPIAAAVSTTENMDYITSQSRPSASVVTVQMKLGADPDIALTEVMSKVQQVRGQLPQDTEDPVIAKGTGRTFALMYLAARNPNMTPEQLNEYLARVIRPRVTNIDGVAQMEILGGQTYAMRIWLDPLKLSARGVTASEVLAAIRSSNFLSAPGKTENEYFSYSLTLDSTIQTPEAFGALPVVQGKTGVVRLRDVARIELASGSSDAIVTFAGEPGTFIGIIPAPGENQLDVATNVRDALPALTGTLPRGMTIDLVYDSTETIAASIQEVFKTIAEAVLIVVVVILLFLGSFRSVLMPIVTIPLSLIGVCSVMLALGYSINLLTLLAMVLAIGLVVDDAIVVVENIHRHIDEGMSPARAAIRGMKEIAGPVIAMTITLAAVLSPLAFTGGLTGSLFTEFALTLAGSVVISGLVALTITPAMSARLLSHDAPGRFQRVVDRTLGGLANWYERRVSSSLDYRPVTMLMVVALLGVSGFMFLNTSSELAPEEDNGALFAIMNGPRYATLEYTDAFTQEVSRRTADIEEVQTAFSVAGMGGAANSGFYIWALKDWADRSRSQSMIQQQIQGILDGTPGLQSYVFAPPSLPGAGGGLPISMVIQSIHAPERVVEIADQIRAQAMKSGMFIVVQNSLSFDAPQVRLTIDRDRAAQLGVAVSDVGATLGLLVGGGAIAQFDRDSNSYDVITQVPREWRDNPERLTEFFVRARSGAMVPLASVVSIEDTVSAAAIEQFNQLNSATLSAMPMIGISSGVALAELERITNEILPDGFFIDYSGQSRLEKSEGNTILLAFGAALVVIYLVLAAQFESFRDPFIILMSVPLSIFGAMLPLFFGASTLNIYTQVGLITLIGLITKHGILMVEFANQQRADHGLSRRQAIVAAAKTRLRPILMTTAAMVLAVVPLIIAEGAGAAARQAMGLVIFAGLMIGTMFTLFVVPMFYTLISRSDGEYLLHKHGEETRFGSA
ncbi:efflux RND transporter permease subunit [Albidovulum sp.]|uniref:efflux RND transporter permease subunit n=1 Tax=Albidovulum sp. TaxID=1872424 RepID=UPI001E0A640A|nr:efflux RND transporter permease subunit [Paracoccaceae bacterium]MCC0045856.1 efflux RND transporter permease subunit [Defluviimonas sp.]HPE24665.1 efflux RND transporter permease subunit [Albidovulum sp.]MCB2137815.1 efflux RND transporter permease subunit [Paracoccaceae bacterium]MCB2157548.1 efflux RND transporter permease subunit [Paracoccaceae bacterium]